MNVTIIGVPYALDQPYTGMGKAPDAMLDAGLVQRLEALGCTTILAEMVDIAPSEEPREERLGHLLARLGYEVARARAAGFFPLVLGGDCLTSLGTLAGLLDPAATGIAWFDAHGDFNTPEISLSGYLGGMPLACAVGRGLDDLRARSKLAAPVAERNVALIGARDLDPLEERALAASSVMLVRANALDGDTADLDRAIHNLGTLSQVYLHVDIDVLDPVEAPGVNFPAAGGLRVVQLQEAVRKVVATGNIRAFALTAVDPEKDIDGRTVSAALDVIEAAIGGLRAER
ncbi:MAG TPA: arginase family protein [Roseiflexaceae bacterium]|jgi:arginase